MKRIRAFRLLLPLAAALLLTGCNAAFSVNIRNRTGITISEIQISPETNDSDHNNDLQEPLAADETVTLNLGRLSEQEIAAGFSMIAVNGEDGSSESFSALRLSDGDTVTLYLDALGLAAAVNTDDAEIQEMIDALAAQIAADGA